MEGGTKRATVSVRYAVKTAPGRASVPLVPGAAERRTSASQPLILSSNALAEGWRGVSVSPSRNVRPLELESYLQTTIYSGESAWWLLGEPVIILLGVVQLVLGVGIDNLKAVLLIETPLSEVPKQGKA